MTDRNKIALSLSQEDLQAFLDECFHTQGLTLSKIQELAAKRGIAISLMAATSFRDTTWKRHIERLQRARELSEQLAAVKETGGSIADAASQILANDVFDALTNRDTDEALDMDVMSKVIERLRAGDVRAKESSARVAALEAALREREAKDLERREKAEAAKAVLARQKNAGLTAATIKTIEDALNM